MSLITTLVVTMFIAGQEPQVLRLQSPGPTQCRSEMRAVERVLKNSTFNIENYSLFCMTRRVRND